MTNICKSDAQKAAVAEKILNSKGPISVEITKIGTISQQQRAAGHIWFRLCAEAFNDAGITVQMGLEKRIDLPWNEVMYKDLVWRPAQMALKEKESIMELYKMEFSDVQAVVERWNGQRHGIHVPFPSWENM